MVFPTNTSHSDYNVLGGLSRSNDKPFRLQDELDFTRTEWASSGNDVSSIEVPLRISFNPELMELRVNALDESKLPNYRPFALTPDIPSVKELLDQKFVQPVNYQLGCSYAPVEQLLQADLLGRKRSSNRFEVGPLIELPLDGSAVKVDPRRTKK